MRDLEFSGAGESEYGGRVQEESSGMRAVFCALLDCVLDYYTTLRKNPLCAHTYTQVGSRTERLSGQQKGYMWCEPGEEERNCRH